MTLVLVGPARSEETPPSIVVTRETKRTGEALRAYSWRKLLEVSRDAAGFVLLESKDVLVGERPATWAHFTWRTQDKRVEQVVVYVDAPDEIVTFSASSGIPVGEAWKATLVQLLASTRFERAHSSAPPPPRVPVETNAPPLVPMPGVRVERRGTHGPTQEDR
jgi:hypothetical protein